MTDEIETDDKKTDEVEKLKIEMTAIRENYDKQLSDLKKAIEERDTKISTLQTYIADHVTQPNGMITDKKSTSFNDKYKDTLKSLASDNKK